jgi:hypothetical protein
VPLSVDSDCCQFRVNVPLNAPLYCPDHIPERSVPDPLEGGGLLIGEEGAGVVGCVLVGSFELLHATAATVSNERNTGSDVRWWPLIKPDYTFDGWAYEKGRVSQEHAADVRPASRIRGTGSRSLVSASCSLAYAINARGHRSASSRANQISNPDTTMATRGGDGEPGS